MSNSESPIPSCVTNPTFCQKRFIEAGGKLPCLLKKLGKCRVLIEHQKRLANGIQPELSKAGMKLDSHLICPMSTNYHVVEDPDEEVMHDYYNYMMTKL